MNKKAAKDKPLTAKQVAFCEAIARGECGLTAGIIAGFSPKSAQQQSSRLLKNVKVADKIAKLKANLESENLKLRQKILDEYKKIAFTDIKKFCNINQSGIDIKPSDEFDGACIQEITENTNNAGTTLKFKLWDKMNALKSLSGLIGMDSTEENNQKLDINIVVNNQETADNMKAFQSDD